MQVAETPIERRWVRFVRKALFIILRIRRRDHIFTIGEEIEMRLILDAETSDSEVE